MTTEGTGSGVKTKMLSFAELPTTRTMR